MCVQSSLQMTYISTLYHSLVSVSFGVGSFSCRPVGLTLLVKENDEMTNHINLYSHLDYFWVPQFLPHSDGGFYIAELNVSRDQRQ